MHAVYHFLNNAERSSSVSSQQACPAQVREGLWFCQPAVLSRPLMIASSSPALLYIPSEPNIRPRYPSFASSRLFLPANYL